ncbi:MAG TPA: hypothetical protein VNJ31_00065 [Methyloceanibacter sp.]|nr:hypothetical protein [Methyloceanibacter sp.]
MGLVVSLILSLGGCSPALAQTPWYDPQQGSGDGRSLIPHTGFFNGKFWTDFRYRYEFVDQANLPKEARASTLKNKTGVESGFFYGFRAGIEGEFIVNIGPEDFNNTINGRTQYPIVADVQSAEVDQAYLESHHIKGVDLLGGRYLQNLDNERFVGSVAWRQNDQTFDGAKATVTAFLAATGLYAYIGNVNRIFSDESPVGNLASNTHLFHLESKKFPIGTFTAYTYLIDLFELDPLSNASYGGFLKGSRPLGEKLSYDYRFEYAHQTDYGDNPVGFAADYVRVEQGLSLSGFTTTLIYELLGSDDGIAAFQTPLATGHIFNGFADVFLIIPPTGLQDFYVEAKYKVSSKPGGPFSSFDGLLLLAQYHEFRSAVQDLDYGSEFDFYAYMPFRNGVYVQFKYANYKADQFFTDVEKVIFGLGYQY